MTEGVEHVVVAQDVVRSDQGGHESCNVDHVARLNVVLSPKMVRYSSQLTGIETRFIVARIAVALMSC